jgi:hypothetical protein
MSRRATDGIVGASVPDWHEEFGEDKAVGGLLEMLPKGPPAVIVNLLYLAIGAFEERDALTQPFPGFRVGNEIGDVFVFHRVETVDVMGESIGLQDVEVIGERRGRDKTAEQ